MEQWKGKKWYAYGTSMTDNATLTPGGFHCGTYSKFLAQYAGLEEHNFGKGGSRIVAREENEDNTKTRCMRLSDGKAEADIITLDIIPNDFGFATLGSVTDEGDDTFCGNLNQILAYLLTHTKAFVAVLIPPRARYRHDNPAETFPPTSEAVQEQLFWEDAVEKICRMHGVPCWNAAAEGCLGYYRVAGHDTYVKDQIHLSDEGGEVLAKYYWSRLQNVYPIKNN